MGKAFVLIMMLLSPIKILMFETASSTFNQAAITTPNLGNTSEMSEECNDIFDKVISGYTSKKYAQLLCEFCYDLPPDNNCSCETMDKLCPSPSATVVCDERYNIAEGTVKLIASFLGVIGNVLVLIVTIHGRRHIDSFEKLIALLASSDLIFSIMQIFNSVPLLWTCKWIYGRVMCKSIKGILNLGTILPLALIVVIAAERYFAIVRRFYRSRVRISLHILLTFSVIFSVGSVIPMVVVIDTKEDGYCLERWIDRSSLIYSWYLLIAAFTIPIIIITGLYIRIILQLLWNYRSLNLVAGRGSRLSKTRYRTNRRVVLMLLMIVITFIALVLPNRIVWVFWGHFGIHNLSSDMYYTTKYLANFPYLFHICVNPIIYSFLDRKFQEKILTLFCCKKTKNTGKIMRLQTKSTTVTETKMSLNAGLIEAMEHKNDRFSSF